MKTKFYASVVSGTVVAASFLIGLAFPLAAGAQTEAAPAVVAPGDSTALPPDIAPSSPLAQVIKLMEAGVGEDVLMAYVTNSTSLFNLDADKIIYLKDIGMPDEVVTAMIQHDEVLQTQMATSGYPPPAQSAPGTGTTDLGPPPTVVTVDYFYSSLAPYGTWVDVTGYGRCWRPTVMAVNANWQPYCDQGHWLWTDDGWYWMSDYSWGWAPFHYGRWFHDVRLGWCWYPGTVWGPSWVTWRYGDGYCGWAPLPPRAVYRAGVGFFYNGVAVSVGFNFGLGVNAFTFVPTRHFYDPHPWHYRVRPREATPIYHHTTVVNHFSENRRSHTFINHGIDPGRITAVTRREIRPVTIREATGHVARREQLGRDGRTLFVTRPHFSGNPARANRVESPHAVPRQPAVGRAFQGVPNGNRNNHSLPPQNHPPARITPPVGQRQFSPPAVPASPGHTVTPRPTERFSAPGNRSAPVTPRRSTAPNRNFNNSTDNRRYPTPRMRQNEPQNSRVYRGNTGQRPGAALQTPPPTVRDRGVTHFAPPTQPQRPAPPPARNFNTSPGHETFSRRPEQHNSPPPAAAHSSHEPPAHSSPPAQSHGSGRDRNHNGRR